MDDAEAVASFAERTFRETFADDNDPADMNAYCAEAFSIATQTALLGDPAVDTVLGVDDSGVLLAYAQIRAGGIADIALPTPVELWRFYVDRRHHGRGLAVQLMEAVVDAARARGARTLWLGVWERNVRAQAFYRKHGFVEVGAHRFVLGTDVQTDRLMARDIQQGG